MKTLVVYGGRFQPPHKGHKASYDHLVAKFGAGSVYVSSADKELGADDPFTWKEKKSLACGLGIPKGKFANIRNAYREEYISDVIKYDRDDTVVVIALSQKDGDRLIGDNKDKEGYAIKKDGSRAAIQWLPEAPLPVSQGHLYVVVTPTVEFEVAGQQITGATQIREMYAKATPKQRNQIITDLYGKAPDNVRKLFDKRLGLVQTESLVKEFTDFVTKF